jgi:hypothetical protein
VTPNDVDTLSPGEKMKALLLILTVRLLIADSAVGVKWNTPRTWTRPIPTLPYRVPPAPGDNEPGEMKAFQAGSGQPEKLVRAVIDRWDSQFPLK